MSRFISVKNKRICVISDKHIVGDNLNILEVPSHLDSISSEDLLCNYRVEGGDIISKDQKRSSKNLRIALVGNWRMSCGISTYAENLWPEVVRHVDDFKLFIEQSTDYSGDLNVFGNQILPDDKISVCWKRGESLLPLVNEIKKYNPHIVWIQHEFGLFPNACHWLSMMTQLSCYRVIVTMHSVFHHRDKTICEAAIPEIVTHLHGGHDVLKKEKGVAGKVYVIPHGCSSYSRERLWNFYRTDKTFMQHGFGFVYKGWENSIKTVAILKEKYPDVFFTGLFSESPYNLPAHQVYYNQLMDLVDKLNIHENVALIRGYQSDATLDSYLRTNQIAVFPYIDNKEHEVFGASGAARTAMTKGLPVVTSSVNHFSDLPTIKADTPEEMAVALERLFINKSAREEQISKQISYINENSWENIGLRYINLFESNSNG